jgi:hypothetical protein
MVLNGGTNESFQVTNLLVFFRNYEKTSIRDFDDNPKVW